jgi:hypothetical protein
MPRRKPVIDRATALAAKVERIGRVSPTAAALIEEWMDRVIAGEPIENIQAEATRLREVFNRLRK